MNPEIIYRDICRGYSEINWNGPIFIKHLDIVEQNSLVEVYDKALQDATTKLGRRLEADLTQELIQEGKWTALKEKSIKSCDEDIGELERSKKKISHASQIDSIYKAIEEFKDKKLQLLIEKYSHLTDTAESYASNISREHQILISCYKDKSFTELCFIDDFEYLDNFGTLFQKYYALDFSGDMLKKISISPFFWTLFTLSENFYDFFSIPFYKLTHNQANLLKYAQTYAKVASECGDLPKEYEGNAEKMIMWFFLRRNGGTSVEEEKEQQQQTSNKFRSLLESKR